MFVLLHIYHAKKLRQYFSKTNGYVILKRKCYPLYTYKTCGSVSVVPKISGNLPTYRVCRPNVRILSTPMECCILEYLINLTNGQSAFVPRILFSYMTVGYTCNERSKMYNDL